MHYKFLLYAGRWQLSTLILAPVIYLIADPLWAAIIGNLIGASIFYWIDKLIFKQTKKENI